MQFIINDLRYLFRDKMLTFFLFTPFFLMLFIRLFVPYLIETYPAVAPYHRYMVMMGAMQTAILFGFLGAFIFLEEKDENILAVIRILPISSVAFVVQRLTFGTVFSYFGALFLLSSTSDINLWQSAFLSIFYALVAPIISLSVGGFAKNKIEGMAYFKGIDLLLVLPILSFFVPQGFQYIFSVVPVFWAFQLHNALLNGDDILLFSLITPLYYMLFLWGMFWFFRKRNFD